MNQWGRAVTLPCTQIRGGRTAGSTTYSHALTDFQDGDQIPCVDAKFLVRLLFAPKTGIGLSLLNGDGQTGSKGPNSSGFDMFDLLSRQGYWPESLLTPPDASAVERDLRAIKAMEDLGKGKLE